MKMAVVKNALKTVHHVLTAYLSVQHVQMVTEKTDGMINNLVYVKYVLETVRNATMKTNVQIVTITSI